MPAQRERCYNGCTRLLGSRNKCAHHSFRLAGGKPMTTTPDANKAVSRRQFLHRLGITGGAGITLGAMAALGIAPEPVKIAFRAPQRADFALTGRASASVLILGAGIAGLTAAYELEKAGYHCQIIEARDRPG